MRRDEEKLGEVAVIVVGAILILLAVTLAGCGGCPGHLTCRVN